MPPNFHVSKHPPYNRAPYWNPKKNKEAPPREPLEVHFPKTELTNRTFGIICPKIHRDIAYHISSGWQEIVKHIFNSSSKIHSYSFPIPLDASTPGQLGQLRAGRMIYEYIEMAENDIAEVAYQYQYLFKTDIKNFYPSIYTHSIPWALHGKNFIRHGRTNNVKNRLNCTDFLGNRLDRLFAAANDGCTNGIPIGPAVSDLIAEIVLAGVDKLASANIKEQVRIVRFKDDYRILSKDEESGVRAIKRIQEALSEFSLELNDEKTEKHRLPEGIFRKWPSLYHSANPTPKKRYSFKRFREVYLAVLSIDNQLPGTGVIDRFLADLCSTQDGLRAKFRKSDLSKAISMLMIMSRRRTKSLPKTLAIIETLLRESDNIDHQTNIKAHLTRTLDELNKDEKRNRYMLMWITYFLRANKLHGDLPSETPFSDPVLTATFTSQAPSNLKSPDFKLTRGVMAASRATNLLEHLDVFMPQ
jgi:hypothetical protein